MSAGARTMGLHEVTDSSVGGKAYGLARLTAMGLAVPPAFVIHNAECGAYPADLDQRHEALGADAPTHP